MSRRRRRSTGAARSLITGDKTRVRVTRQRRHKQQCQQQASPAVYVPSNTLPTFSLTSDRRNPPPPLRSVVPNVTSSLCEKKDPDPASSDTSESTVSEGSGTDEEEEEEEEEEAGAVGTVEGRTTMTFPTQPFARFEVKIEKRGEQHFTIAVRNPKTNEEWESELTQLRDFVTEENRIPLATLDAYIKCFKDVLEAPRADPVDLVPAFVDAGSTALRLEIALRVRMCSMQWLAKFEFYLFKVKDDEDEGKLELAKVQARLQKQESEIESLRLQVVKLLGSEESKNAEAQKEKRAKKKYGIYYRASSVFTATRDEVIDWCTERTSGDAFHNTKNSVSTLIRFARPGLFAVLVVVHHSNCEDESEAFQLLLNGECVQSCFASNAGGVRQTSSLVHFVRARVDDKLAVKYKGSGSMEAASFIEVNLME